MKNQLLLLGTVLLTVSLFLGSANAESRRRPTYDLNVRKPIDAIKSGLEDFLNELNFWNILLLLGAIAPCLSQLQPQGIPVTDESLALASLNSSFHFDERFQHALVSNLSGIPVREILDSLRSFEGYCNTPDFKSIHNFIWKTDDQFPDLLNFLHQFGYPDIYSMIKGLYVSNGCPQELIDELPTGPSQEDKGQAQNPFENEYLPNIREQMKNDLYKDDDPYKCDILKIIKLLPETGIPEFLKLINTVYSEFSTNPSVHFLVGKIQEPVKGDSVRKFKRVPAVARLLIRIHQKMKATPLWILIFEFIRTETGLDFFSINPVDLILSFLITIIWPDNVL